MTAPQAVRGESNTTSAAAIVDQNSSQDIDSVGGPSAPPKVFLQSTRVAVYEVVHPTIGMSTEPYRTVCLHKSPGYDFVKKDLPLRVLVPHYEPEFFDSRQFVIEFDEKMFVEFSGADLLGTSQGIQQ